MDFALWIGGMLTFHAVIFSLWGTISPRKFEVSYDSATDVFGRPLSGALVCKAEMEIVEISCLVILAVTNLALCFVGNYWSIRCRCVETEYAESNYIGFSLGTIFESIIIGIPLTYFSRESPNIFYVVTIGIVILLGLVAPLLIFVPKFFALYADMEEGSKRFDTLLGSTPSAAELENTREPIDRNPPRERGALIRHPGNDDVVYDSTGHAQSIRRPLRYANVRIPEAPSTNAQ